MKHLVAAISLSFLLSVGHLPAREFSVLAFNVENLFDVDGEALFDDYRMAPEAEADAVPYSPALLRQKLAFVGDTLAAIDGGRGPDIVLFQELERDRTPESTIDSVESFLRQYEETTVREMLSEPFSDEVSGLPAVAFLLKELADRGMSYPYVATPEERPLSEDTKAHINAVFSRFPIREVITYPTLNAREVLSVEVEVDGHPFILINNHWKSGASRVETETTRIANARTTRRALEAVLAADPAADVVVGGDLNSYYNQILLFPEMGVTGINSVLGSQGDEEAVAEGRLDLYNLWFELPIAERYTETWRDRLGTLMHLIITPGLYDDRGVRYVDGSFARVLLPGRNIDEWGRPIRFRFAGGGRGGSDHLPVLARFETVGGDGSEILELDDPGTPENQPSRVMMLDYEWGPGAPEAAPAGELLSLPRGEWAARLGDLFLVEGKWSSWKPPAVESGGEVVEFYSPRDTVWARLNETKTGDAVRFRAELGFWDGEYQWIVRDPTWLVGRRGLEPRTN